MTTKLRARIVTLGCARNDTDSEALAGQLEDEWELTDDSSQADVVLVNTCGFIDAAKKDSIDTMLELADLKSKRPDLKIVAVGCLAQRYGAELADALPEVDAILGFADYPRLASTLRDIQAGRLAGAKRTTTPDSTSIEWNPSQRHRLETGPYAPLKIASGCDRRCAFCAIPGIRGPYRSRPIDDVVAEARWLVTQGVKEVMLVSENTSSYGKDMGEPGALEMLLTKLGGVDGLRWVRVSYLQPAEVRPSLLEAMANTANVVPYFDLSFQHASGPLLKRMRRFGDAEAFLGLLEQVRALSPLAGVRSSVIVGFPGETDDDIATLTGFLEAARLDAIGVFGYSDEDGTLAHGMDGHVPQDVIDQRVAAILDLTTWLTDARAADRVGEQVQVLVESIDDVITGRAAHQGPEVDGTTTLTWPERVTPPVVGDIVDAVVTATDGVDLIAQPMDP